MVEPLSKTEIQVTAVPTAGFWETKERVAGSA